MNKNGQCLAMLIQNLGVEMPNHISKGISNQFSDPEATAVVW
jgi:hypothetical protein